jgi:dolichol-phosphate mannosyltransferase
VVAVAKKFYILLPAFNEENSMRQLISNISEYMRAEKFDYRIIVCNDGSKDRTQDELSQLSKEFPFEVITHKLNRGLGETARDLFERAAELAKPEDYIIRLDADNTHEPQNIGNLICKLEEGYDVVTASRFQKGGGQHGVSAYRAFVSYCAQIFMKFIFGFKGMREFSCGFRAYRAEIIKKAVEFYGNNFIQLKGMGFTGTLEKMVKLKLLGAKFAEVGFQLRYDKKTSYSKMVTSITTLGYLTMAFLYHWPWGGWKSEYRKLLRDYGKKHS